jgi:hypothetical protein
MHQRSERSAELHPVLVDAHVHFYPGFDPAGFFEAAVGNFDAAARQLGINRPPLGCLLFTETPDDHFFTRLAARDVEIMGWTLAPTGEERALMARRRDGRQLLLGAGRQIGSAEDLEVLALATTAVYPRRPRFGDAFESALATAGAVVLPWGFGKWWFRRGALVRDILRRYADRPFFLGDNAGRLAGTRRPPLFAEAERTGHWVLPGSDPLPLPGEDARPGSYGCVIETTLDAERPLTSVLTALHASQTAPRSFGSLTPLPRFCSAQVRLQVRKRMRRRGPARSSS